MTVPLREGSILAQGVNDPEAVGRLPVLRRLHRVNDGVHHGLVRLQHDLAHVHRDPLHGASDQSGHAEGRQEAAR